MLRFLTVVSALLLTNCISIDSKPMMFVVRGDEILADGVISKGTANQFEQLINKSGSKIKTVVLASDGGLIHEAMALGLIIRDHKLNTRVDADCASACAMMVFASGVRRSLSMSGKLRVHQIFFADSHQCNGIPSAKTKLTAQDVTVMEQDIGLWISYLQKMDVSPELVSIAVTVKPWESPHVMTSEELKTTRLVNQLNRPTN